MSKKLTTYVNSIMVEVNALTDQLYEAFMDQEDENIQITSDELIALLNDIKMSHPEEDDIPKAISFPV